VERVFGYQALEEELGSLAIAYGSPNGITLLAKVDGEICGGGAYRRLGEGVCEMKRLFVSDRFKGRGIGRQLCAALIESARAEGFELMRLDTANLLTEAIALYRSVGFQVCEPYRDYPEDLMPFLVFMELSLGGKG
jgi:ribosomal protein S18 acetylase RimI-like enzyme